MAIRLLLFLSIFIVLTSSSCNEEFQELMMSRTPYNGDELRIDGYYYSDATSSDLVGLGVFYRDGVCIHFLFKPETADTLNFIENEFLLNAEFIENAKNRPNWIGVFNINGTSLDYETFETARNTNTRSYFAEIINDTTFVLQKEVDNLTGNIFEENITYRFKEFSPKPDSTNMFIN